MMGEAPAQAGHIIRGSIPRGLRVRRRMLWATDSLAVVPAVALGSLASHRVAWPAIVAGLIIWALALVLAGAHTSGALRMRRQAVAAIIAAIVLTGFTLTVLLIPSGLIWFAMVFTVCLLVGALAGRFVLFARMERSPVVLVLVMDAESTRQLWPRLSGLLGDGYRVGAIVNPDDPFFADQLLSVLSVRNADEIVLGPGVERTTEVADVLGAGRFRGIQVMMLDELYEDLTGKCLDPEERNVTALRSSIWRATGARMIDLAVALLFLPVCALAVPLSMVAGGPALETDQWLGKDGRLIRVTRLPQASKSANWLRRMLAWKPIQWAPAFWQLAVGTISVVGPAPLPVPASEQHRSDAWRLRQTVRPGITGWAAINAFMPGPSSLPFDLYYVRHRSLGFDLAILLRTVASPLLSWRALGTAVDGPGAVAEEIMPGALTVSTSDSMVSVVVPAYREGGRITSSLDLLVTEMQTLGAPFEVIVVSDGNSDGTEKEARRADGPITVIHYSENRGKGYALRRGLIESRGARVVFIDADMELHPRGIARLLALLDAGADVAVGSKRHPESLVHYPWTRRIQSASYQWLVRRLFGLNVTDTQTGIKAFRGELVRDVVPMLTNDGFSFDLELLVQLVSMGAVIAEGPITLTYHFRSTTSAGATIDVLRETLRLWHRRRQAPIPAAEVIGT